MVADEKGKAACLCNNPEDIHPVCMVRNLLVPASKDKIAMNFPFE
jgi:hypothetical protein